MEFRCGATPNESRPFFACPSPSQCVFTEGGFEVCEGCPKGFVNDFLGFGHFSNCGLPDNLISIFFIVLSCLSLPLIASTFYRAARLWKVLPRGRQIMILIGLSSCSFAYVIVLGAFLQNGIFEVSLIAICIWTVTKRVIGIDFCRSSLKMLQMLGLSTLKERLFKSAMVLFGLFALVEGITSLFALAFCREADPKRYNMSMLIFVASNGIGTTFSMAFMVITSAKLTKLLNGSAAKEKSKSQSNMRRKYLELLIASIFVLPSYPALIIQAAVWAHYGSVPYSYVPFIYIFSIALMSSFSMYASILSSNRNLSEQSSRDIDSNARFSSSGKTLMRVPGKEMDLTTRVNDEPLTAHVSPE